MLSVECIVWLRGRGFTAIKQVKDNKNEDASSFQ